MIKAFKIDCSAYICIKRTNRDLYNYYKADTTDATVDDPRI